MASATLTEANGAQCASAVARAQGRGLGGALAEWSGKGDRAMTCPAEPVSGPCISSTWDESHSLKSMACVRGAVRGGDAFGRVLSLDENGLGWA